MTVPQEETRTGTAAASLAVLVISPQFPPLIGGYERAAERLSGALAKAGVHVVVITERREHAWPRNEFVDGYEVRRLFCLYWRHLHAVTSLLSFAGFLLRHGQEFDVWHVHQYGLHGALAIFMGKLLRRPVVLKLTSSAAMGIEMALGKGMVGRILGCVHRWASACLAVSKETFEEAMRFGFPNDRIHLIPNGVDGRKFYPATHDRRMAARQALGLHCERLVVYVGRLSSEKNPLGLLDAWATIDRKTREGALLVLVGDGPECDSVCARAQELMLGQSVHLAGRQTDIAMWYQAADIYVIPSHLEGLSNTMIEAMACGLPVVATRVSGTSVLIESPHAGLVVEIGDVRQLAGAMTSLLCDELLRSSLGRNARLRFESRFSLDRLSDEIVSLYQTLASRRTAWSKA